MSDVADDAGRGGWTLIQISELVRRAEELLLDGVTLVGPHAHAGMPPDATIELGADGLRRVATSLLEGVEISEQLELLATRLPDGRIDAPYDAVRDAIADDLATGIVEPRRVLLAARLLDVPHGWEALAASLAAGDVVSAWGALTVEELLGRFRNANPRIVAQVVEEAGLGQGTRFAACPAERLAALAAGLRRHASGQPAS
ncbi:MAG TPA: hypothetical protein VGO48_09080 [Conexibacter sp.]|jgi:hypothetical protein|nr:hypothetical protein [Conexibacter sp.]